MCINCGCEGVTYPNGSDGIGITSITDNGNGTFTILMSDGSSFISPDYTGPIGPIGPSFIYAGAFINGDGYQPNDIVLFDNALWICILGITEASAPNTDPTHWSVFLPQGVPGANGLNGTTLLFSDTARKYAGDSNTTFSINPSYFSVNGDSIRITFIHGVTGITTGTLLLEVTSNGSITEKILEDDFTDERISKIEILLSKSSVEPNTLKGFSMLTTTTGNIIYSGVTIGNYLTSTSNVFTLSTNSSVEDSWFDTVTVELLKMID